MAHTATPIPGDGTGPEIVEATRRVIEAAGVDIMEKFGAPLPEPTLASIRKNKVALKEPITTPIGTSFRSVKFAFDYAREVAKEYPEIEYGEWLADAMCMSLVQRPEHWDVLVLPNLFGDILSDLCAGLVGGLGVAPGANIGEGIAEGKNVTYDFKADRDDPSAVGTSQYADAITEKLKA